MLSYTKTKEKTNKQKYLNIKKMHRSDHFWTLKILKYIFDNKTQKHTRQTVSVKIWLVPSKHTSFRVVLKGQ